jgi:phosphoglycerate dehydrogenase-like enzyme
MKVLLVVHHRFDLWRLPPWFGQRLAQQCPDLQIAQHDSYEGIETELRDAEVVFTISLRPDQFAAAHTLRWIHTPSAAVHQMLFPELINSSVILTNSREVHGPVVAEHVLALMFALAKKIPQSVLLQQKRIWGQETIWNEGQHPQEIAGATLGLIGVGRIGRGVAHRAKGFNMRVLYYDPLPLPPDAERELNAARVDLGRLLAESDFVSVHVPLTQETHHLLSTPQFGQMKNSAILINTSRGPVIDEAALVEALKAKKIAGAGLDAHTTEPLPPGSPFWTAPNTIITPHNGATTPNTRQRGVDIFVENLGRYQKGEPLRNIVNKAAGY